MVFGNKNKKAAKRAVRVMKWLNRKFYLYSVRTERILLKLARTADDTTLSNEIHHLADDVRTMRQTYTLGRENMWHARERCMEIERALKNYKPPKPEQDAKVLSMEKKRLENERKKQQEKELSMEKKRLEKERQQQQRAA